MTPSPPGDEVARLAAVRACAILDTPRETSYDALVFTAAQLFRVPMAMLTIVGDDRVWLKANVGPLPRDWPRRSTFCATVVAQDNVLVVEDATSDARFSELPLVAGRPNIRFYAGVPLHGPGKLPVGTLGVMDHAPRTVPERARVQLLQLAREAEQMLSARTREFDDTPDRVRGPLASARGGP